MQSQCSHFEHPAGSVLLVKLSLRDNGNNSKQISFTSFQIKKKNLQSVIAQTFLGNTRQDLQACKD